MSDIVISPRILWKVNLSFLNGVSRSYSEKIYIFSSYWKLMIKVDEEWDEFEIYIMPENPEIYSNVRFIVHCGIRDNEGICKFEMFRTETTETLLDDYIWSGGRNLLIEENVIQSDFLCVLCSIEPEAILESYQILTDSAKAEIRCTSMPCTNELIGDFNNLLKHGLHHDVILECEDKIIKAHKNVLSCRSEMFGAMLKSNTKEALEGKVVIRDTPFDIFQKIIRYMYTAEINLENVDMACKIYAEADKYLIASLKERCDMFFKAHLSTPYPKSELGSRVTDACKILCLADYHADVRLEYWTKDYLANSPILVTPEWSNFADNNTEAAIDVYFKLLNKVNLILRNENPSI